MSSANFISFPLISMANNRQMTKRDEQRDFPSAQSPFSRVFDPLWDPFRLFETSFFPSIFEQRPLALPVDVSENDNEVVIEADIPGFDPKDLSVDIRNNMLTISGKHETQDTEKDDTKWHRRERNYSYAQFTRQILLPEYADTTQAECTLKNGTLIVRMPKKAGMEPKHLNIRVES
jgi:HSP20 family protein